MIGTVASLASAGLNASKGNLAAAALDVVTAVPGAGTARGAVRGAEALLDVARVESGVARTGQAGNNLVYQSFNAAGQVNYVGITNNLERRTVEQFSSKGISIDAITGLQNLSRSDARAVEQTLIEFHGLSKNGGTLMNKINSISGSNPAYSGSLQRGSDLLKQSGYPGF